jgi:hypothetical protein
MNVNTLSLPIKIIFTDVWWKCFERSDGKGPAESPSWSRWRLRSMLEVEWEWWRVAVYGLAYTRSKRCFIIFHKKNFFEKISFWNFQHVKKLYNFCQTCYSTGVFHITLLSCSETFQKIGPVLDSFIAAAGPYFRNALPCTQYIEY